MNGIFSKGIKSDMSEFSPPQLSARINFMQNNSIVSPTVQLNFVPNKALLQVWN